MNRREVLAGTGAFAAMALLPRGTYAQNSSVLKFIPRSNLVILDPLANTTAPTQTHGYLVFDTLFGLDEKFQPQLQMLEDAKVSSDEKTWTLTLRDGLTFHDGSPVTAADVEASINRWAQRDTYGKTLFARVENFAAVSENQVEFKLTRPFPHLPSALGKVAAFAAFIMPKRLLDSDPAKPVSEIIGSGPYRFLSKEYVPGAFVAYEKFADYKPRGSETLGYGSGPKVANFDRVEWHIVPDPSTAMAAIQSGELDWWEMPQADFLPILEALPSVKLVPSSEQVLLLRLNHLTKPFDNPEIRRLLLSCIDRTTFMQATGGSGGWTTDMGIFLGNDAGMSDAFKARTDFDAVKAELANAGYKGEPVVMLVAADTPIGVDASQVGAELMRKMGFNVDYQSLDFGTVAQRRTTMEPTENGGWSCFFTPADNHYFIDPATNFLARAAGKNSWFGWPSSPKIEELTEMWLEASDGEARAKAAEDIQRQAWIDVPYIPLGMLKVPGAAQANLDGFAPGFPKFYGVHRT